MNKLESNNEMDTGFPPTDLILVVEGRELHVNKAVLVAHSPVFEAMFTSDFKEKHEPKVELKEKSWEDFNEFLRSFYPNMKHSITKSNVLKVLPIAHEFQSPVKDDCEHFMISRCSALLQPKRTCHCRKKDDITARELLEYIIVAEKYELSSLLEKCIELGAYADFGKLAGKEHIIVTTDLRGNATKIKRKTDEEMSNLFKSITAETRFLIVEKRLSRFELKNKKQYDTCMYYDSITTLK